MLVEKISNNSDYFCKLELTKEEAIAIIQSLCQTMSKGKTLTISIELEDKLCEIINEK